MDIIQYLVLGSEPVPQMTGAHLLFFPNMASLRDHVFRNQGQVDRFILVVPGEYLESLPSQDIYPFLHRIHIYYEHNTDMKRDEQRVQNVQGKLHFHHERILESLLWEITHDVVNNQRHPSIRLCDNRNHIVSKLAERVLAKRARGDDCVSSASKRLDQKQRSQTLVDRNCSTIPAVLRTDCDTFIWRIADVQNKIERAECELQKSIYSPEFYSSKHGYKLRLRLYLNGDYNVRNEYASLFVVLMRNERLDNSRSNAFSFAVRFRLMNRNIAEDEKGHIVHVIRPDGKSPYFLSPTNYDMNQAFGIKKFVRLGDLEENSDRFIHNNTMHIEVILDFFNEFAAISASPCETSNDDNHLGYADDDESSMEIERSISFPF